MLTGERSLDPTAVEPKTVSAARSEATFEAAKRVLPGGVARATVARRPHPIYADRGEGAWLVDIDGNRYLDFNNNFTTLIHGHSFAPIIGALTEQLTSGTCFANPTPSEIELASTICARVPAIDKVRFVNTGTEAVMFAIKAARAYTGRTKVAKLEGAYHGSYDWAEVSESNSPADWGGPAPVSNPNYQGTPRSVLDEVVVLPLNDVETSRRLIEANADDLACVLIDVMPSRAGLIPAEPDYLAMVRDLTHARGVVLISDEVLNFRQDYRGASARFGLEPDLITLGKVIGGGLPVGAVGGRERFMAPFMSDLGRAPVAQGGTFSANPLSMIAGQASLNALDDDAFAHLERLGEQIRDRLSAVIADHRLPMVTTGQASLFKIHPKTRAPRTYREAYPDEGEAKLLARLCDALLSRGVNLPSNGTGCLSTVMTDDDADHFLDGFEAFARTWDA